MTTLLVVSPHLDDAVLSCGGAMRARVQRGDQVVVATVFTEGEDHARRRDEDRRALRGLGAAALHLGLFDAPERLGLERSHRALVEQSEVSETDAGLVRDAVRTALGRVQPDEVWAPLGVGEHIDHRVVHVALRDRPGVVLYEDRPYAFLPGAVRGRLVSLGACVRASDGQRPDDATTRDLQRAPERALVVEALERLPHLRAYLAEGPDGARSRAWLAASVARARPEAGGEMVARVSAHDAATAEAVACAIATYASQVGALFGGPSRIASALRNAALAFASGAVPAPHAERSFVAATA